MMDLPPCKNPERLKKIISHCGMGYREDAIQEAWLAHVNGADPSLAVSAWLKRELRRGFGRSDDDCCEDDESQFAEIVEDGGARGERPSEDEDRKFRQYVRDHSKTIDEMTRNDTSRTTGWHKIK